MRAHASHNVIIDVDLNDAKMAYSTFVMTLPYRMKRVMDLMVSAPISPVKPALSVQIHDFFQNESAAARVHLYSQTIMTTLRSPQARDLSYRFRQTYKIAGNQSSVEKISREDIGQMIIDLVERNLLESYSELAELRSFNGKPPQPLASLIIDAMSGN